MIQFIFSIWWLATLVTLWTAIAIAVFAAVSMEEGEPTYHSLWDLRRWVGSLFWPLYIIWITSKQNKDKVKKAKQATEWAISEMRDINRRERGEYNLLIGQMREMTRQLELLVAQKKKQEDKTD